jgi:hypothetical protein
MNDGTLSAIVAADRLALSDATEGKELLHRRLTVLYGYFALLRVHDRGRQTGLRRRRPASSRSFSGCRSRMLVQARSFVALRQIREPRLVRAWTSPHP